MNPEGPPEPSVVHPGIQQPDLTSLVVPLMKGVLYREDDAAQWAALLQLQARVRDYVAVLALELVVDEAEGYAFFARPAARPGGRTQAAAPGASPAPEFSGELAAGPVAQEAGRV